MCKLKFLRLRRVAFCTLTLPPCPRIRHLLCGSNALAGSLEMPQALPAALQPRRFCQFSVTLMGLIIFELCSCTVFFSSIFVVFCFSYFVGLTIHKFVFEVGPKGRRQLGEKIIVVVAGTCCCRCSCRCCCCCCCCCSCRCKVPIVVATACDVLCHCLISF